MSKLNMSLVPPEAIEAMAEVLSVNASDKGGKYPLREWEERPKSLNTHFNSLLRHVLSVLKGDYVDDEDGVMHIDKVLMRAAMMTTLLRRKQRTLDDLI